MKLRVWHVPQFPMNPIYINVDDVKEAVKIMRVLVDYDLFQLENNIKPDYCNAQGLEMWDKEENDWMDWYIENDDGYFEDPFEYVKNI